MWDSMIPSELIIFKPYVVRPNLVEDGLGYVNGTVLAPEISMISTFHQLHCLVSALFLLLVCDLRKAPG